MTAAKEIVKHLLANQYLGPRARNGPNSKKLLEAIEAIIKQEVVL